MQCFPAVSVAKRGYLEITTKCGFTLSCSWYKKNAVKKHFYHSTYKETLLLTTVTEVSPSGFVVYRRSGDRRAAI